MTEQEQEGDTFDGQGLGAEQGFRLSGVQAEGVLSLQVVEQIDPTWGGVEEPDVMED